MNYRFGEFEIDTQKFQLRCNGEVLEIEPKVFDLLCYLIDKRDRLVTRDELFEKIWPGQVVSDTSLSNQIKAARKAIGDSGNLQSCIKTVHGRGYQFVALTEEMTVGTKGESALGNAVLDIPDKPSIAVLPFNNMNADPTQDFFSDGITEDIITELSRFGSLFVVARNSSFAFRGDSVNIREIGKSLGVRFVLEGSVRIAGNKVRITGQLIDALTGDHVWADRYDGDLADVFAVQDEITRSIVSTIAGRIEDFDHVRIKSKPIANLSAYENVLRGQHLMHNYTEDDYLEARRFFEYAISLDSDFARAHAFKAYAEFYIWIWHMAPEKLDHALQIGEAALALDDHESKSHLAVGVARLFRAEHDKAEYHLHRAASLNPNDDLIMIENGRYLMYTNKPLEGVKVVRQAMRQNPYHPNWYWNILGRCFHTAKHFEDAVSAFERIRTPQFWNHAYLAACYSELGESKKAAAHLGEVHFLKPDFTISEFATVLPYRDQQVLHEFIVGFQRAGFAN